jgi:hypothetical protein
MGKNFPHDIRPYPCEKEIFQEDLSDFQKELLLLPENLRV